LPSFLFALPPLPSFPPGLPFFTLPPCPLD
jgi:hypothetical protein